MVLMRDDDVNIRLVSQLTVTSVCFSNHHLITCFLGARNTASRDDVQLSTDSETRHCHILPRHPVLEAVQLYDVGR